MGFRQIPTGRAEQCSEAVPPLKCARELKRREVAARYLNQVLRIHSSRRIPIPQVSAFGKVEVTEGTKGSSHFLGEAFDESVSIQPMSGKGLENSPFGQVLNILGLELCEKTSHSSSKLL